MINITEEKQGTFFHKKNIFIYLHYHSNLEVGIIFLNKLYFYSVKLVKVKTFDNVLKDFCFK